MFFSDEQGDRELSIEFQHHIMNSGRTISRVFGRQTGSVVSCVVMEGCLNCFLKNEMEFIRRGMEMGIPDHGPARAKAGCSETMRCPWSVTIQAHHVQVGEVEGDKDCLPSSLYHRRHCQDYPSSDASYTQGQSAFCIYKRT